MTTIRQIEKGITPLGQRYDVSVERGRVVLNSDNANYSFGSLHQVMQKGIEDVCRMNKPEHVLMLGLGGGSAIEILEKKCNSHVQITAVEIDPGIIDVAERHFGLKKIPFLQVICTDAQQAVTTLPAGTFDLIIDDVFLDSTIPDFCFTSGYLLNNAALLKKQGVYMRNIMCDKEQSDFFEEQVRNVFGEVRVLVEPDCGNRIYLCRPGETNQ